MQTKVCYLDDEALLAKLFRAYMEKKGVDIRTFTDAATAIAACASDPPHVLFIDYRLVDTTGDKVAATVDSRIKKVLVTGDLATDVDDQFSAVLRKPFRLSEAFELVRTLVGHP